MIVLFGATGFTGGLTARALARGGDPVVLAARDGARVAALARELGAEHAVADAGRPETLRALVGPGDVLVSTVGPFARLGRAALDAAIAQGAHYLDSTGEAAFIRDVFARGRGARGVLLTAFGFDYVPGNLAGALALREAGGGAVRLDVGYFVSDPSVSGGTRASGAGILLDDAHAWRDGRLVTEPPMARTRPFDVRARPRRALSLGGTEAIALPRLAPGLRHVRTYLGAPAGLRTASAVLRLPGLRTALRPAARRLVRGSSGGPDAARRAATRSDVVAEARDAGGTLLARVHLAGPSPYDLTAELLAWGAGRAATGALRGRGALGPAEATELSELQAACERAGLVRQG